MSNNVERQIGALCFHLDSIWHIRKEQSGSCWLCEDNANGNQLQKYLVKHLKNRYWYIAKNTSEKTQICLFCKSDIHSIHSIKTGT